MPADSTNHRSPQLTVLTITSDAGFAALKSAWNDLEREMVVPNLFLTHDWFSAAWAWRRLDSTLDVQVARRNERVVGILPLLRNREAKGGARRLELLTVVDTQRADFVAAPSDLEEVARAFVESLAARRDWDVLQLSYLLPQGAIVQTLLPLMAPRGLSVLERDGGRNPFVALAGTWDDYYRTCSRRLKKGNNLVANRLKKAGEIRIDWLRADSVDQDRFAQGLDSVIDISRRSWKRETGNALDQPGPQGFIRSLSAVARERGWLSIWILYIDNKSVAMEYQLIDRGDVHALRADFDAQCDDVSPGSNLFRHLLESLFGLGYERYYMGPGDNAYKTHWTDRGEPLRSVMVYNRTFRGRLAWFREAVAKPALRRTRDGLSRSLKKTRGSVVSERDADKGKTDD